MLILLSGCGGSNSQTIVSKHQTAEYNIQYGLNNINAAKIYADGYSGDGVTVAVIDLGVDLDHPDLVDNIAPGGYDYFDDDDDASADSGGQGVYMSHGTHVAGVIAAVKNDIGMHGVAYNAKILALRAGNADGFLPNNAIGSCIDRAISQGAKVINASFSSSSVANTIADKWLSVHNNDIVSVFSAGNDFLKDTPYNDDNPLYAARLPISPGYEALADTLIAVVATDSTNTIADYSNRCGDAQDWCMAAPGSKIYSTVDTEDLTDSDGDGYGIFSGTSLSAPHVSGAVAILRSKWPSKSAAEVVRILYDTATDLGDPGTDSIYGRGLLNLDNALYAQGTLAVVNALGGSHYFSNSGFSSSSTLGDALNQLPSMAVFDRYRRDYYVDLTSSVQKPAKRHLLAELQHRDLDRVSVLDSNSRLFSDIDGDSIQLQNTYGDLKVDLAYQQNPDAVFSLAKRQSIAGVSDTYSLHADSYFSKLNQAKVANIVKRGNIDAAIGLVSGYTDEQAQHRVTGVNSSVLIRPNNQLSLTLGLAHLQEQETFLSNYFSGAYQTGTAETKALNLTTTTQLNDDWDWIAQYNKGKTQVNSLRDSAVSKISAIDSESYALSLVGRSIYAKDDLLFTTIRQPMKINNGQMTLNIASGLNLDDSISFTQHTLDLKPSGTEKTLTIGYLSPYGKDSFMSLLAHRRNQPNHQAGVDSENQFLLKFTQRF